MTLSALLPERVVVAREVASLFGGVRVRLEDGVRRVDPVSLAVDDKGVDVARLLSLVDVKGQPRRIAALCRRLPDVAAPASTAETAPLPALLAAWTKALSTSTLAVTRRSREHPRFAALKSCLDAAGVVVTDLQPQIPQRVIAVDDAEVLVATSYPEGGWKTVCDAGQGAMLAAGLCFDVAAFFVEAAGKDGEEVWEKHFDDVSRAWFVQRIERVLRKGFGQASIKLSGAELVPPLPSSTSRVHQLTPDAAPKLVELAHVHRAVQQKQRAALAKIVVELRLPQPRGSWWQEKLEGFTVVAGDPIVVVGEHAELQRALAARGAVVEVASARWLVGRGGEDADDDDFGDAAANVVVAPRAVGGVRATVDFDTGVGATSAVIEAALAPVAALASAVSETREPREIDLPATWSALSIHVDDVVVDGGSVDVRGLPGALKTRVDVPVRHGSLVVVAWDVEDKEEADAEDGGGGA